MVEIYIHIGERKTGTTFLQKEVFPKIQGVVFLHNPDLETLLRLLALQELNETKDVRTGKLLHNKFLISSEGFSGSQYHKYPFYRDNILQQLHTLFPNAKIIVTYRRNNTDFLKSYHNQWARKQGVKLNFDDFISKIDTQWYNWTAAENKVTHLWSNVLVLEYEDLVIDAKQYVKNICDFIGVDTPKFINRRVNQSKKLRRKSL